MVNIIAAVDKNFGLGIDGKMSWHIPEELKFFKHMTSNGVVIMGRTTFDSLGKPLPNRINYVISSKEHPLKIGNIKETIEFSKIHHKDRSIWIIGGASIYGQSLEYADKIWLSHIPESYEADKFFPTIKHWKLLSANEVNKEDELLFTACCYVKN